MSAELKSERIQVLMTPSEVLAVDDWAHQNRIKSRGEAIRRLTEMGLSGESASGAADLLKELRSMVGMELSQEEMSELTDMLVVISRILNHSAKVTKGKSRKREEFR